MATRGASSELASGVSEQRTDHKQIPEHVLCQRRSQRLASDTSGQLTALNYPDNYYDMDWHAEAATMNPWAPRRQATVASRVQTVDPIQLMVKHPSPPDSGAITISPERWPHFIDPLVPLHDKTTSTVSHRVASDEERQPIGWDASLVNMANHYCPSVHVAEDASSLEDPSPTLLSWDAESPLSSPSASTCIAPSLSLPLLGRPSESSCDDQSPNLAHHYLRMRPEKTRSMPITEQKAAALAVAVGREWDDLWFGLGTG